MTTENFKVQYEDNCPLLLAFYHLLNERFRRMAVKIDNTVDVPLMKEPSLKYSPKNKGTKVEVCCDSIIVKRFEIEIIKCIFVQ